LLFVTDDELWDRVLPVPRQDEELKDFQKSRERAKGKTIMRFVDSDK